MNLLTFKADGGLRLGLKTGAGVIDVAAAGAALGVDVPATIAELLAGGEQTKDALSDLAGKTGGSSSVPWLLSEDGLAYGPCVPAPGKIICVGLNYRRHAEESNLPIPTSPVLFSKFSNTIAAHGDEVALPANAVQYDYEAELCVVIGKRARNVSEGDALGHVFGYCSADDISVRELQTRTSQWLLGKTLDKTFPIGPYLVTADAVGDPQKLQMTCTVNGEIRQNSNTADMIFTVAQIISYISEYFPLEAGDVITTGTPEGVAMGRADKPWLKPGDEVIVEVEKLGALRNIMTA